MTRAHQRAHRMLWLLLACLLTAVPLLALAFRPIGPTEAPQIQLAPPK